MALEETLALDIRQALTGIDRIEAELAAAAQRFKVGLSDALGVLMRPTEVEVDATPVTTAIDSAVQAADTTIEPDDTSAITAGIDDAVAAADATVPLESEGAESITADVDGAVSAADATVPVEAIGAESITSDIDSAVNAADTTVEITADTASVDAALQETASNAGAASESVGGTADALGSLQGASQLAAGDLAGVSATLGSTSNTAAKVTGGLLAVAAAVGATASAALESETAQRRYNAVLGEFAEQVANPAVEGFADSLEQLAERTGNSDESLKLAAARVFDLGRSSDIAGPKVAATTEQIVLLATRASVLNPTLGDAGALTDALTGALARGGRTLNDFGLSITAAEIEARALADTQKRSADELTQYDRAAAGAAIATERLGERLRTDIVAGAGQPAVALRRLREEFGNTLEAFGAPLLGPLVTAATAAQPVLLTLAETFAELAEHGLPLVVTALGALEPALGGTSTLLGGLFDVLDPIVSLIDKVPEPLLAFGGSLLLVNTTLRQFTRVGESGTSLLTRLATSATGAVGAVGAGGLTSAFSALISPIGLVTIGLATTVTLISRHNDEQKRQREELEKGRKAFLDSAEATAEYIDSQVRSRIESKNQTDDLTRLGLTVDRVRELTTLGRAGLEGFADTMVRSGEITREAADEILGLVEVQGSQVEAAKRGDAGNVGLLRSVKALTEGFEEQSKSALKTLVSEERLTQGTADAIVILTRRRNGTNDYAAAVREANLLLRQQATEEIAAGRATEEARAKSAALTQQYDELAEALRATTEGTTASETAMVRYGPALGAAVDQYVRGKPSIEALAAIQARFGVETELLSGLIDEHKQKLEEARQANEAFVRAGVEGLTSITEAGKVLDEDKSFQQYIDRIRKTAQDQVAFGSNIAKLIARGADDIASQLLEQGVAAAGFAAELTKTGDKRLTAQEKQLEATQALFTTAETVQAANGQALVNIQTASNTALGNVPPPNLAAPMTTATDQAKGALTAGLADIQREAATGGLDIGRGLELGVAAGIGEAAINAHLAAEAAVEETRRRARARAKAFSPSLVFAELGRDMVAGLVVGLSELTGVRVAADRLALTAVPDVRALTSAIPSNVRAVAVAVPTSGVSSPATAGSVGSPSGSAVTVSAGGALVKYELHFEGAVDRAAVVAGVRDSQPGVVGALEGLLGKIQSQ